METKFCSECGEEINKNAEICPKCGVRVMVPKAEKNPGVAAVLSFLFVGLGQIYNGQIGKGLVFIVVQIINIFLIFVVIGFITYPLFWIFGIYDAYDTAKKINNGEITV